ncbi:MAG: hypothetical protein ACYDDO_01500 [Acidiferrobacterales bacterium]
MRRAVVYVNVLLYLWTGYAFVRNAFNVYAATDANAHFAGSRLLYAGLCIFAALYTAICASGLALRSPWSRSMAFWWNLALALIIGGFPLMTVLWLAAQGSDAAPAALHSVNFVVVVLAGALFLALGFAMRTAGLRDYFVRAQDPEVSAEAPRS